jgi:chromosome segregation ATPase
MNEVLSELQKKLDETTAALNRERGLLEQAVKDHAAKSAELGAITAKAADAQKNADYAMTSLNQKKSGLESDLNALVAEKTKAFDALVALKNEIEEDKKNHKTLLEAANAALDAVKAEGEKLKTAAKAELADIEAKLSGVKSDHATAQNALGAAQAKIATATTDHAAAIAQLADKRTASDDLDADIAVKQTKSASLDADIKTKSDKVASLDADIASLSAAHDEQAKAKAQLDADILAQQTEKDGFVKAKFDLAAAKQALNNREAIIKAKYAQAGVAYTV